MTTSLVYPRIDIQSEEQLLYSVRFTLNKNLKKGGNIRADIETSSITLSQQNYFRFYALSLSKKFSSNYQIGVGRISHWNPLYIVRVDGIKTEVKIGSFGNLMYLGGIQSTNDFSKTRYSIEKNTHYFEWNKRIQSNWYSLNTWRIDNGRSYRIFSGFSYRHKFPGNFVSSGYLLWDVDRSAPDKVRIHFIRKLWQKYTISLEYRYRSLFNNNPYPWIDTKITSNPLISISFISRVSSTILWTSVVSRRGFDNNNIYFRSTIHINTLSISLVAGRQNFMKSMGGTISTTHYFTNVVSAGGSLSYKDYTFNEEFKNFHSMGLYGWIFFTPKPKFSLRITSQFYQNRYFNRDGRVGLSFIYAI